MQTVLLKSRTSKGKIKYWECVVEHFKDYSEIRTRWWQEGSKIQLTIDKITQGKNLDKSNATDHETQSIFEWSRKKRLKEEEGYAQELTDFSDSIDWETGYIPDSFAPPKPAASIEPKDEQELIKNGNALYFRKHNGQRHIIIRYNNGVKIYSRRMEDRTDRFQKQVEIFEQLLDPGEIIDAECVIQSDNPDEIKEICGCKPEEAIKRQKERGWAQFKVFDWLYSNFKPLTDGISDFNEGLDNLIPYTYVDRWEDIQDRFGTDQSELISAAEFVTANKRPQIPNGWEGLVLWDAASVGTKEIRWDGKPSRKAGCYKIKEFDYLDAVAYKWVTGKGKNNNRPAKLLIGLYKDDGTFLEMGECGSGLTEADKDVLLDGTIKLPCSFELQFEEITDKLKFRLPVFIKWRPDKNPIECLLSDIK